MTSVRRDGRALRAPVPSTLATLVLTLGTLVLAACGAPQGEDCPDPMAIEAPAAWLAGDWDVADAQGAPMGTLVFRQRRLTAITAEGWHAGAFTLESDRWPWQLLVDLEEGEEGGVRIVHGSPRRRAFALVPVDDDRILALQEDGVWALWIRDVRPVVPEAAP